MYLAFTRGERSSEMSEQERLLQCLVSPQTPGEIFWTSRSELLDDKPEAMSQLTVAECFSEYLGVQIKVILYDTV